MSLTPPSSHGGGLPPGLSFLGWTSDTSDPANVSSNGGALALIGGNMSTSPNGNITTGGGSVNTGGGNVDLGVS